MSSSKKKKNKKSTTAQATSTKPASKSSKPAIKQKDNLTKYLVFGMVAFVLLVGVLTSVITSNSSISSVPKGANKAAGYAISYKATSKNAPTIDLWEDFQCPSCQRYEMTNGAYLSSLITQGKINANFHILSFLGSDSVNAANASACMADQGKFLEFHSYLYSHQGAEQSGTFSNANLLNFAASLGLSSPSFTKCVNTAQYTPWVNNVALSANKAKINATPTIFLNGKQLDRQKILYDPVAFKKALGL